MTRRRSSDTRAPWANHVQNCGTYQGAQWHYQNGEKPCEPCRLALNAASAVYSKKYRNNLRQQFLTAYGHACACCGEDAEMLLTIGHLDGGGKAHRQQVNAVDSKRILLDLKRRSWPPIVRTECFNCNLGAARNGGVCPHRIPVEVDGQLALW